MEKRNGSIYKDPLTGKVIAKQDPDNWHLTEDEDGKINNVPVYVFPIRDDK